MPNCMGSGTAATGTTASGGFDPTMIIMLAVIIVIFVVLIILPNRKKEKQFKQMMESIKVGDSIKTIGGFYGKIVSVKEDLVVIECGPDKAKLTLAKSAIASVESFNDGAEIESKSNK